MFTATLRNKSLVSILISCLTLGALSSHAKERKQEKEEESYCTSFYVSVAGIFGATMTAVYGIHKWFSPAQVSPSTEEPGQPTRPLKKFVPRTPISLNLLPEGYDVRSSFFLGEGSFGKVYRVRVQDRETVKKRANRLTNDDSDVAVKVIRVETLQELESAREEVASLSLFTHPNILRLIEQSESGLIILVVTELASSDLEKLLEQGFFSDPSCGAQRAIEASCGLVNGLRAIKEKKMYHRDIKPANILVGTDGQIKIADFGLTEKVCRSSKVNILKTAIKTGRMVKSQTSDLKGTIFYMPPEMLRQIDEGSDKYDTTRVDRWPAAMVVLAMMEGKEDDILAIEFASYSDLAKQLETYVKHSLERYQQNPLASVIKALRDHSLTKASKTLEQIRRQKK